MIEKCRGRLSKPGKLYLEKAFGRQSGVEVLCEALAVLGLEEFRELCAALNKEYALEEEGRTRWPPHDRARPIWSRIARALAQSPARELRAALQEIAYHVRECEISSRLSPLRGKVRRILVKAAKAADRIADRLEDNEAMAANRPDPNPASRNAIFITGVQALVANVACPKDDALPVVTVANENIPLRETERAVQIVYGAKEINALLDEKETVGIVGPHVEPASALCRTPSGPEQALRLAVEQWAGRQLAASIDRSKLQARVRQFLTDVEFLIEIEALHRRPAMFTTLPSTPIRVPADPGIGGILEGIRAHWVASAGDIVSSRGMRALSVGIESLVKSCLPPHRGSHKLADAFGAPKGHELCAVAANQVYQAWRGWRPAHDNPEAQRLCSIIWRLAGFGLLPCQQKGKDSHDGGWEDPLRLRDDGYIFTVGLSQACIRHPAKERRRARPHRPLNDTPLQGVAFGFQ